MKNNTDKKNYYTIAAAIVAAMLAAIPEGFSVDDGLIELVRDTKHCKARAAVDILADFASPQKRLQIETYLWQHKTYIERQIEQAEKDGADTTYLRAVLSGAETAMEYMQALYKQK